MPSSSSERMLARRVLIEDIRKDKRIWLRHGVAALAVSLLGLGVAGSVALTGAAQHTTLTATVSTNDLPKKTSRAAERSRLDPAIVKSLADQRAELLSKIDSQVTAASMDRSAAARARALEAVSDATRRQAVLLARGNSAPIQSASAQLKTQTRPKAAYRSPAGTASRPASASSARGLATTPVWTSPPRSAHRSTLLPLVSLPTPGSDLPAAGLATMSPSSTRMAPIP